MKKRRKHVSTDLLNSDLVMALFDPNSKVSVVESKEGSPKHKETAYGGMRVKERKRLVECDLWPEKTLQNELLPEESSNV